MAKNSQVIEGAEDVLRRYTIDDSVPWAYQDWEEGSKKNNQSNTEILEQAEEKFLGTNALIAVLTAKDEDENNKNDQEREQEISALKKVADKLLSFIESTPQYSDPKIRDSKAEHKRRGQVFARFVGKVMTSAIASGIGVVGGIAITTIVATAAVPIMPPALLIGTAIATKLFAGAAVGAASNRLLKPKVVEITTGIERSVNDFVNGVTDKAKKKVKAVGNKTAELLREKANIPKSGTRTKS